MKKQPAEGAQEPAQVLRGEMIQAQRKLWHMLRSRQTEGIPISSSGSDLAVLCRLRLP